MSAMKTLRVGTRSTPLALAQTRLVCARIESACSSVRCDVVELSTLGDREQGRSIPQLGNKGVFTAELEAALREGRIDLAVHSAKDLPAKDPPGLCLHAVPMREDPHDALICPHAADLGGLEPGSRVGTGSVRRVAQLRRRWPELSYVGLRGSVGTRLAKCVSRVECDAAVLAVAGLRRLGLEDRIRRVLSVDECVPAGGQGALAVQGRAEDRWLGELLGPICCPLATAELSCERGVLSMMGAACNVPMGVLARSDGVRLQVRVALVSEDGTQSIDLSLSGTAGRADTLAARVAASLKSAGAEEILGPSGRA